MPTAEEEIAAIEAEILRTQKNKATEGHIGRLKGKLARLREEIVARDAKAAGGGHGIAIKKSGHATVGLVGAPSTGKSTLLNVLTNAQSEVGDYAFTTVDIIPGIMEHKGAKIQVLDMPGIIAGASKGRGRGREILSVARGLDLVLLVVEASNPDVSVVVDELRATGLRLNESPPEFVVRPTATGGIQIACTVKMTKLTAEAAADIVRSYGHVNADVVLREDMDADRLVDALAGNRVYTRAMAAVTKADLSTKEEVLAAMKALAPYHPVPVAASLGKNLDRLRDAIYENLSLMRIYLRPPGGKVDTDVPMVVRSGSTIEEVARTLHRDMLKRFRYAQVTGPSAKYPQQTAGLEHTLCDGDILTLVVAK